MALLQILEPGQNEENQHNEEVVIGIDLGTTNSLVAIVEEEKVKFFADENGCEIHPSIVNYDENGNVINVGQILKQAQDDEAFCKDDEAFCKDDEAFCKDEKAFCKDDEAFCKDDEAFCKDEKAFCKDDEAFCKDDEAFCQDEKAFWKISPQRHPELVSGSISTSISSIKRLMGKSFVDIQNQKLNFEIDQNSDQKEVLRILVGDRKIRPAEISSEILKYLKNLAEKSLKTEIKKAVITVPAYFDEAAKNATKLAANLAGLEVLRLVNEPTAAALAYGLDNSAEGIYCVYDLGGGTFDVSILKMQKGVFKVLGVSGDNALGGDDFDHLIAEKFQINLTQARKIKEKLSNTKNVTLSLSKGDSSARPESPFDKLRVTKKVVTVSDFENLILPKIAKTFTLTKNLIEDLELESEEIKGVILVGGSTRIPLVKRKLAEIFGQEKILDKLDPDRIVAAGAAWQAYNLSKKTQNLLLDVIPLSLGIEMMGGIVDKVIHRNSTIPTALTKEFTTYADNQNGMKFHIVQGERELAADCRSLAEFEIKNIPAMKAGLARVAVNFKVDADGLLTVTAEEKITKQKQEIIVKPSYSLDENEIKKMLLDSLKNSKSDVENRLLIQTIVEANKDMMIVKKDLENSSAIDEKEKKLISEKLENLEKLISRKTSRDAIILAQQELGKAAENLILRKVNAVLNAKIAGKKIDEI
jgi:molecular chaperone HscA